MVLINRKALFLHIPKTGGLWIREALHRAGASLDQGWGRHMTYREAEEIAARKIPSKESGNALPWPIPIFTFVRHPAEWYKSYWRAHHPFMTGSSRHNEKYPLIHFRPRGPSGEPILDPNFHTWIEKCITHCPGHVTRLYRDYGAFTLLKYIGKQEELKDNLFQALKRCDIRINIKSAEATPRWNVSSGPDIEWDKNLRKRLCDTEVAVMNAFDYD